MKALAVLALALGAPACFTTSAVHLSSDPASAPDELRILRLLVGEWEFETKASEESDAEGEWKGVERIRAIGDYWVIAEYQDPSLEVPFHGLMSIGYDAEAKEHHGTWIDSTGGFLWRYEGTLSESGDRLELLARGPNPDSPDGLGLYKDVITLTGEDTKTLESFSQAPDGSWALYMTASYRRRK